MQLLFWFAVTQLIRDSALCLLIYTPQERPLFSPTKVPTHVRYIGFTQDAGSAAILPASWSAAISGGSLPALQDA